MALKKILQLKVSERKYLVGFNNYVRTRLTPIRIGGSERTPKPDSVRKVLAGERESRRLLLDIFQNGTDLMRHPSVCREVAKIFKTWQDTGRIPENYGKRGR